MGWQVIALPSKSAHTKTERKENTAKQGAKRRTREGDSKSEGNSGAT